MKKILSLFLIIMSVVLLSGCGSKENNASCPSKQCVYERTGGYYFADGDSNRKTSEVKNAVSDYTTIKTAEKLRKTFMGFILDDKNLIKTGYVCAVKNEEVYCLKASKNGEAFESNKKVLFKVFGENNCKKSVSRNEQVYYHCADGDSYATIYDYGWIEVKVGSEDCHATASGQNRMSCSI